MPIPESHPLDAPGPLCPTCRSTRHSYETAIFPTFSGQCGYLVRTSCQTCGRNIKFVFCSDCPPTEMPAGVVAAAHRAALGRLNIPAAV